MASWMRRARRNSNVTWRAAGNVPRRSKRRNRCVLFFSAAVFVKALRIRCARRSGRTWTRRLLFRSRSGSPCGGGQPWPPRLFWSRRSLGMPGRDLGPERGTLLLRPSPQRNSSTRISAAVKRSEEHTSELQSRLHLVCRLLLEKKKQCCTSVLQSARCHNHRRCLIVGFFACVHAFHFRIN